MKTVYKVERPKFAGDTTTETVTYVEDATGADTLGTVVEIEVYANVAEFQNGAATDEAKKLISLFTPEQREALRAALNG